MVIQQIDLPTDSDTASTGISEMPSASAAEPDSCDPEKRTECITFRRPALDDGRRLWRMVRDTNVLDVNSSYAYLLWCRDFAGTSVVADIDGRPVGFITAYLRPDEPSTLMVWQVAVDAGHRGKGLAGRMLANLADRPDVDVVETTITADNVASDRLFRSFAHSRGAALIRSALFTGEHFPDGHDTEFLYRIGPLQ